MTKVSNSAMKMATATLMVSAAALLVGCEKSAESFSLLSDSANFQQSTSYVQRKIDILWVVDNSGSMESSQTNLTNSFNSFISRFSQLNYDFHMGVIATDAYLAYHYNQPSRSRLSDGVAQHSGIRIIDKNTPNMSQVFIKNATQGINGSGDERAFSSFESALGNSLNTGFVRDGAFLAIIIVSDEDDFSHYDWQNGTNSYIFTENYNYSTMFPISRFTTFLDNLTHSAAGQGAGKNYSVSTISILDSTCQATLNAESPGRKISQRYNQLADATGGTKGSLCANFGTTLQMISDRVIELSSVFKLDREPIPETIRVIVDGQTIPNSDTNGWSYNAATLEISFHGPAVPPAGSDVRIYFDPKNVKI